MLSPDKIAAMDAASGLTTAPQQDQGQALAQSRANEIRQLAQQAQTAQENRFGPLGTPIVKTAKAGVENIKSGISDLFNPQTNPQDVQDLRDATKGGGIGAGILQAGATGLKAGEKGVAGLGKIVGGIAQTALSPILGPVSAVGTAIGEKIGNAVPTDAAMKFANMLQAHPEIGKNTTDIMNMANLAFPEVMEKAGPGLDAATTKVQNLATNVNDASGALYKAITEKNPAQVDKFISEQYQKGVRPTVAGKNTGGQLEAAQGRQVDAVKSIVANKPNLKIVDQYGELTGTVPKTLNEFTQAIDQTKASIFQKYNALQEQAGEAGAKVDLKPVASELQTVASDKVLNDLHPEVAKYAQTRADTLNARGTYTTEEAQTAIKNLNKSLEAFYKNPSYETASRASIDALMVNKMREGLDATIEQNAAPGYQDLKNEYGALRSIEKDVVHRAIVDGRKNSIGLMGNIGDIASGAELVRGLLTLNPVDMAASGTIKGISAYTKYLNNPNTAIKRLFEAADKQATKTNSDGQVSTSRVSEAAKQLPKDVPFSDGSTSIESVKTNNIPADLQSLAEQARNYKNAEEFAHNYEGGLFVKADKLNELILGGPGNTTNISNILTTYGNQQLKNLGVPDLPVVIKELDEEDISGGIEARFHWDTDTGIKDAYIELNISPFDTEGDLTFTRDIEDSVIHELTHARQIMLGKGNRPVPIMEKGAEKSSSFRIKSQLNDFYNKAKGKK